MNKFFLAAFLLITLTLAAPQKASAYEPYRYDTAGQRFQRTASSTLAGNLGGAGGAIIGLKIGFSLGGPVGAGIGMFIGTWAGNVLGTHAVNEYHYMRPQTSR